MEPSNNLNTVFTAKVNALRASAKVVTSGPYYIENLLLAKLPDSVNYNYGAFWEDQMDYFSLAREIEMAEKSNSIPRSC